MDNIIPVIATLLGGLLGFLASTFTNRQNNRYQSENENKSFRRKKKEELYLVVAKLKKEYREYMGSCLMKVNNGKDFDFKKDPDINLWEQLSMITNLYFPELKASINDLFETRDKKVGKIIGECLSSKNITKKESQDLNARILVTFEYIEKHFEKFHDEIVSTKA